MIYRKKQYLGDEEEKLSTDIIYGDKKFTQTQINEQILDQIPTYTATGTTINVKDSSNLPIKDFALLGNTYQAKSTGKNMFDKTNVTANRRLATDGTLTSNNATDMWTSDFINIQPNTTYTKNSPTEDAYHRVCLYTSNDESTFISASSDNTFSTSTANYIRFCGYNAEINTTQLELGSTATTYEPYTNGQPSPSPSYPQPIQVVTGDNTLAFTSKNMLNLPTIQSFTSNGITSSCDGKDITLSNTTTGAWFNILSSTFNNNNLPVGRYLLSWESSVIERLTFVLKYEDGTTSGSTFIISSGRNYAVVETSKKAIGFRLFSDGNTASTTISGTIKGLMLEKMASGNTRTTYEPYAAQTQLISLGDIELAKIPNTDYKDKIFKAVQGNSTYDSLDSTIKASLTLGSWYKQGNIKKRTYNGTENWLQSTNFYIAKPSIEDDYRVVSNIPLSNYFKGYTNISSAADFPNNVDNVIALKSTVSSTTPGLYIRATQFETTDDLKTWLSTHNTNVYYVLRDTAITYTEITDTTLIQQLDNVLAMSTYKNETNAFSIVASGNVEGELQIEYYQDIATLINDLRTAILSL